MPEPTAPDPASLGGVRSESGGGPPAVPAGGAEGPGHVPDGVGAAAVGDVPPVAEVGGAPRARFLLAARIAEQAALGLGTFVLAGVLGPEGFAPVAALTVLNFFVVVTSDFGLGLAVMRHPAHRTVSWRPLRLLRLANLGLTVLGVLAGVAIGGELGLTVGIVALMWSTSAEGFVRKSAALRLLRERNVALAEILGSAILLGLFLVVIPYPDAALAITGAAFIAKQVVEAVVTRGWRPLFSHDGDEVHTFAIWGSQVLSFASKNVDYLIVGLVFSPAAFGLYSLGWRAANVAPAQISRIVIRVSMVGFARDEGGRQELYDRYNRSTFGIGLAAGLLTAVGAFLLPLVLDEWGSATMVIVIMALAVPFRMVLGVAVSLAMGVGSSRRLLVFEVARLVASFVIIGGAALLGFGALVAAVTIISIVVAEVYNRDFTRVAGLRPVRYLLPAAVVASLVAMALAPLVELP